MPRVAITGLGTISAIGNNLGQFLDSLRAGRSGIRPIETVDRSTLRFQNGAEVPDYDPEAHFDPKTAEMIDRFTQFAVIAAREALRDSGVELNPALRAETAIVTGSCVGGHRSQEVSYRDVYKLGRERVHPLTIPRVMANAGASQISMEFGIMGPGFTLSTACSSSAHAIGLAAMMVRSGMVPLAIAGGSEAPFTFGNLKAWEALRVVSRTTCRPFSRDRDGMILGEGAAMMIVEPLETARARGAKIYAEFAGFGMSSDAEHITHPSAEGAALAMRRALQDAGIAPEAVGYINAHGTGTLVNDVTETASVRRVFGAATERIPVSSTKSMHGHALGAAGALEAAAAILALHEGVLPPTANFTAPDPECNLNVVQNVARQEQVEYALSNSFAFGGLNASLLFRSNG